MNETSLKNHIAVLEEKHQILDDQIDADNKRPRLAPHLLRTLKCERLSIKGQLEAKRRELCELRAPKPAPVLVPAALPVVQAVPAAPEPVRPEVPAVDSPRYVCEPIRVGIIVYDEDLTVTVLAPELSLQDREPLLVGHLGFR